MKKLDFDRVIEHTIEMIELDTYEHEDKITLLKNVEKYITDNSGARVDIHFGDSGTPYLVAHKNGTISDKCLMFQGHIDVVSPEGMDGAFKALKNDEIIRGRGAVDMKSGCAAMLEAFVVAASSHNLKQDISLVLSSDEEYDCLQMVEALAEERIPKSDFCIIAEPTSDMIGYSHSGNAWLKVTFEGQTAHGSMPEKGINAIHQASTFIEAYKVYLKDLDKKYEGQVPRPTMNIGTLSGGTKPNSVPGSAELIIDLRYLPEQNAQMFLDEIQVIIDELKKADDTFKAFVEIQDDWSSLYTDQNLELFKRVISAVNSTREKKIDITSLTFWGEGGTFSKHEIPTIYYGPGESSQAHTQNETVTLESIKSVVKAYEAIVKDFCF